MARPDFASARWDVKEKQVSNTLSSAFDHQPVNKDVIRLGEEILRVVAGLQKNVEQATQYANQGPTVCSKRQHVMKMAFNALETCRLGMAAELDDARRVQATTTASSTNH